jgi:hypothetical protein
MRICGVQQNLIASFLANSLSFEKKIVVVYLWQKQMAEADVYLAII